jgi:hypothetical protein
MRMFAGLRRDNRGVSAIATMIAIPVLIVLVFGILEIWKVMAVKQSLYLGTYKAARQLSWLGPSWLGQNPAGWESRATQLAAAIVREELDRNALLPRAYALNVGVSIEAGARGSMQDLGWLFTVRSELQAPGLVSLLGSHALTLAERQVSFIEGPNADWKPWTELPEGWPY